MKISIVVSNSLKKDPRVIKQIKAAMAAGYEVQFVGYRDEHLDWDFLNALGCRCDIVDFGDDYVGQLHSVYKKIRRRLARKQQAIRYLCNFQPDVIHANDFDMLGLSYRAAKKCKAGLVYDSHEIFAENIGIAERKWMKRRIIRSERRLVRKVDRMISVSNAAAAYFEETYAIRPTVITNCPMKNTLPLLEKASDAFEVVYQGLMVRGRGYEEFTDAAALLPDGIRLVLRGYGSLEPKLRADIKEKQLSDKVVFAPPVEVAQLVQAASASHVGAVLTRPINLNFKLSVSNKVFEYAAAGLPVILSDVPEHRYLNEQYDFGLIIDEVTPEKIAEAILTLYREKELYSRLAENAKRMSEEMNWETESEKLLAIYRSVFESVEERRK